MKAFIFTPFLALLLALLPTTANGLAGVGHVIVSAYGSAPLAVKIGCQNGGSGGPTITIHITNVGAKRIGVMAAEPYVIVDLTVLDESGKPVAPLSGRDGNIFSSFDHILQPGQSLDLTKYAGPDLPPNVFVPIADWGYRNLASGTYTIIATASEPLVPAWSSRCTITVK